MSPRRGAAAVRELGSIQNQYGGGLARRKSELITELSEINFSRLGARNARLLAAYHDSLLFISAYPDNKEILRQCSEELAMFPHRIGAAVAKELSDSGIARTRTDYPFDYANAKWLARIFPSDTEIAWEKLENDDRLQSLLSPLAGPSEDTGIDDENLATRDWIDIARGNRSALGWLIDRLEAIHLQDDPAAARLRAHLYDSIGLQVTWKLDALQASHTGNFLENSPIHLHTDGLRRGKFEVDRQIRKPLVIPSALRRSDAIRVIDFARAALLTREREMYPITHANPDDVTLFDLDRGLRIALFGTLPERRLLPEALWGFLLIKNGFPVGYGCISILFGSAEIAFNVFDAYRQGESVLMYLELLRVIRAFANVDSFTVTTSQFGEESEEGIRSGAFWFYYKLGFRPFGEKLLRRITDERKRIESRKGYRSSPRKLKELSVENLYMNLGSSRRDVLGNISPAKIGLAITRRIAERHGSNRDEAIREARKEVGDALGVPIPKCEATDEFCLLLSLFQDLPGWTRPEKRALAEILDARSDSSERDFCIRLFQHKKLRNNILSIVR